MTTTTTKKTPIITTSLNGAGDLVLTFSNGKELLINKHSLNESIQNQAMLHGLKQKLCDAAAIARDTVTGRSATVDDKYDAVLEVYNRITSAHGTWNADRTGDGSSLKGGVIVAAMMDVTGKSREAIIAFLDTKSKEEIAALRLNKRVADVIVKIQAQRADISGIDTDSMLDELA